mmetsp:Transcript_1655/g.4657  ORF Transcript_1655/g.4657 Transcript_1655/m.4657 type:complete len:244 (+) Transcript_1655:626-1357(+)
MAIREQRPEALLRAVIDHFCGLGFLPLAQRDVVARQIFRHRQCLQLRCRVHAGRQDEQQWRRVLRLLIDLFEVKRRGLNELGVQLCGDEDLRRREDAVRADAPDDDELLQGIEPTIPLSWQRLPLGFTAAVPLLPVAQRLLQRRLEALEGVQLHVHLGNVVPDLLCDPVGSGVLRLRRPVQHLASEEEEAVLRGIQIVHRPEHSGTEVQRQQELMALEQGPATESVHSQSMELIQVVNALFET